MSNTWNGMTFTNIARTGFAAFMKKLTPFGVFSTDFSADAKEQGEYVQTRIVPLSADAVDMSDASNLAGSVAFNREDTNIIKDITTTAVQIQLSEAPAAGFVIPDHEAAKIAAGILDDTRNKVITTKAYAVANYCLKYSFNLLRKASYTNTPFFTGAASTMDIDDIFLGRASLEKAGWDMDLPTYIVLDPVYYAALASDGVVKDLSASGLNVVKTGDVGQLLGGLVPVSAPSLSGATSAYTTDKVRGFVCQPSAMAVAMRPIACQAPDQMVHFETMTDPETGITLVYRAWYKGGTGQLYHNFETLFGASVAQTEALSLILEAAE